MEYQTIVPGLLKARNGTGTIKRVNFAGSVLKNRMLKFPLIVTTNGVYDAGFIFVCRSRHDLRQFFHSTNNLARVTATPSTHTRLFGTLGHGVKGKESTVVVIGFRNRPLVVIANGGQPKIHSR